MPKKRKGNWSRAAPDDPIYKEGLTVGKGRYTNPGRLPPDHPIYKEGLTIYTPLTDRGPARPAPKKAGDKKDRPKKSNAEN